MRTKACITTSDSLYVPRQGNQGDSAALREGWEKGWGYYHIAQKHGWATIPKVATAKTIMKGKKTDQDKKGSVRIAAVIERVIIKPCVNER